MPAWLPCPTVFPAATLDVIASARDQLVVGRERLAPGQLAELAAVPDAMVPSIAALAHEVRLAWCGDTVEVEGILSAKTGGCPEDCHFCAQSSRFDTPVLATPVPRHRRGPGPRLGRRQALGASEFCLVLAVRGPRRARPCGRLLDLVPVVHRETGLNVAVSAGILGTDPGRASRRGRRASVQPQPGDGPVVLPADRHHPYLGRALRIPASSSRQSGWSCAAGSCSEWVRPTPSASSSSVSSPTWTLPRCRSTSSIPGPERPSPSASPYDPWRRSAGSPFSGWAFPDVILRYAGGRELTLGELQAMGMTSGINALIVGNYLTTLGRSPDEDLAMLRDLRMPIGALSRVL